MIIRKISEHSIAKSVLASLTANQNPWFRRKSSGIFVVAITVEITISSGTAAARVQSPTSHENATRDFECTDEVRREIRMRESDPCKANHSHFRVRVFQDALREEDQPHGEANQENACRTSGWPEEEPNNGVHSGFHPFPRDPGRYSTSGQAGSILI